MIIYRCKECHKVFRATHKGDIGTAHAHAEKHAKPDFLGLIELPRWFPWPVADPDKLGEHIEELYVTVDEVSRETVKGNPCEVQSE